MSMGATRTALRVRGKAREVEFGGIEPEHGTGGTMIRSDQ
jgi:hypothetical protein